MEQLLPYLQEELATLRRDCRELSVRYPRLAGMLGITDDACGDPHVERLIQACALLSARVSKKLDDDYPRFTQALLQTTYPHYLRPFPSCSVIQIDYQMASSEQPRTVPRGTDLKSRPVQGVRCHFRTSTDVVLSPLGVTGARYIPVASAPEGHRIDHAFESAFEFSLTSVTPLKELEMKRLTLFINGEASLCAALRDALFLRTAPAFVRSDGTGPWYRLPVFPIHPAGFQDSDALLPWPARSHPAYRLLTEYFAFPDKFNFIEIDLAAVLAKMPQLGNGFTLHLPLRGLTRDAATSRTLANVGAGNLLSHCAPVINLHSRAAAPIDLHRRAPEYPLLIDLARPAEYELYSIDTARLISGTGTSQRTTELRPFYGRSHGQGTSATGEGGYWITHRDDAAAEGDPGHEIRIALVDHEMRTSLPEAQTLSVDITCSNRDVPSTLAYGRADGDLQANGILDSAPIRFLRKPTLSRRFPANQRAHWRLISHLALNQRALSDLGLVELRKMLTLYDLPCSPITQRQIEGIVALSSRTVHEWVRSGEHTALMAGIDICVTVDESAYVASGLHVFIQLLDRFLALYGQINVFTRLRFLSATTGQEILLCPPRSGMTVLS
ncbi:type VI secretion system protein ImpG [Pseudoduganella lurida]|uniref:Type VI secretion system protein ImpG n=1 Tax=Pseudoduganella lurida TaxID=1036180 RepID=A0A562REM0_9BURK|nr:type VI secretion system baseplate subunit TssF [Pseudoduganella lurida]TWI67527.1 type VI secretion system protein ImpG [Pseudoduganella lurida]